MDGVGGAPDEIIQMEGDDVMPTAARGVQRLRPRSRSEGQRPDGRSDPSDDVRNDPDVAKGRGDTGDGTGDEDDDDNDDSVEDDEGDEEDSPQLSGILSEVMDGVGGMPDEIIQMEDDDVMPTAARGVQRLRPRSRSEGQVPDGRSDPSDDVLNDPDVAEGGGDTGDGTGDEDDDDGVEDDEGEEEDSPDEDDVAACNCCGAARRGLWRYIGDPDVFFTRLAALMAMLGTAKSSVVDLYDSMLSGSFRRLMLNVAVLGAIQVPTTLALIYFFIKAPCRTARSVWRNRRSIQKSLRNGDLKRKVIGSIQNEVKRKKEAGSAKMAASIRSVKGVVNGGFLHHETPNDAKGEGPDQLAASTNPEKQQEPSSSQPGKEYFSRVTLDPKALMLGEEDPKLEKTQIITVT